MDDTHAELGSTDPSALAAAEQPPLGTVVDDPSRADAGAETDADSDAGTRRRHGTSAAGQEARRGSRGGKGRKRPGGAAADDDSDDSDDSDDGTSASTMAMAIVTCPARLSALRAASLARRSTASSSGPASAVPVHASVPAQAGRAGRCSDRDRAAGSPGRGSTLGGGGRESARPATQDR